MKPGFFHDVQLLKLSPLHRLLFEGLWCYSDREGRMVDDADQIKHDVLPADDCDIEAMLGDLCPRFIKRYQVGRKSYIEVRKFSKHQNPHKKENPSVIPPGPPDEFDEEPDMPGASQVQVETKPVPTVLIPDSLNLIPDSGFPQPAIAEESTAPQEEEPNEQPLEFRDMLHRYVRRKGLKKPTKPILDKAEVAWNAAPLGDTLCDIALDGFHVADWWRTADEPLLGFTKDARSWIPKREPTDGAQRVNGHAKVVAIPTVATDAPQVAQRDFLAEWNAAIPDAFTEREPRRKVDIEPEFVAAFDKICEIARGIRKNKPDSTWLDFYWLLATKPEFTRPNWTRLITTMRGMALSKYPESGQVDDTNDRFRRWMNNEIKPRDGAERSRFVGMMGTEMMNSKD